MPIPTFGRHANFLPLRQRYSKLYASFCAIHLILKDSHMPQLALKQPGSGSNLHQSPVTDLLRTFDHESISELISYYKPLLYAVAKREWNREYQQRIGVSDAVQNTLIAMVENAPLHTFPSRTHFKNYLTTILRNHLRSIRRKIFSNKRSIEREIHLEMHSVISNKTCQQTPNHLDAMIEAELAHSVLMAISKLPKELQRILRWRYRKGMTLQQIASRIERKPDAVRYLLEKCIVEIRREIRREFRSGSMVLNTPIQR